MIKTEHLLLRELRTGDLADFFELMSCAEVVRFEPYSVMNLGEAEKELERRVSSEAFLAIALNDTRKVVGNIYLGRRDYDTLELGFLLHPIYWHKGIAREACSAVIKDSFQKGIHRVYAECDPENEASWHLLERLGFSREGHFRQNVYFHRDDLGQPIWKDTYLYALLNEAERS